MYALTVGQQVVLTAHILQSKCYAFKMNHVHLFAFSLCQKAVFLNLLVPALVAYKTSEYFSIHLVEIYRATVITFGVATRI